MVAVLAFCVSILTLYNGSSKQSQFETNRQLCVEALDRFGRTLLDLRLTDDPLSAAQQVDYVFDSARARVNCFDSGVLDADSQFLADWITAEQVMELPIAALGDEEPDQVLPSARAITNGYVTRMLDSLEEALVIAITTPGPGFLPWENPTPTAPASFAPLESESETPAPPP